MDRFQNGCTAAYVATVRGFVLEHIVKRMIKYRVKHNMYEAAEREDEWDELTDLTMGATRELF